MGNEWLKKLVRDRETPEEVRLREMGPERAEMIMGKKATAKCAWCGKEMVVGGRGRPKRFCSNACRQKDKRSRESSK